MTFRKPFSEKTFNKHDPKAREKVKEIFKASKSLTLKEPDDKYAADLDVYKNGKIIGHLELEIKNNWNTEEFKFPDVQFLERKKKYAENTVWVLFSKDLSRHMIARIKDVVTCPTRDLANKYSNGEKERFYVVPITMVTFDGLPTRVIEFEDQRT